MFAPATASQTVGPFFAIGMTPLYKSRLFDGPTGAGGISVRGQVFDGNGEPISDALLELWQADATGRYATSAGAGFGRVPTDEAGAFCFHTVLPGRVPGPAGTWQAPHISVCVFMRGLLRPARTRLYFPADPSHTEDAVLALVPAARRSTLIARAQPQSLRMDMDTEAVTVQWDVHMQGEAETVFFEF